MPSLGHNERLHGGATVCLCNRLWCSPIPKLYEMIVSSGNAKVALPGRLRHPQAAHVVLMRFPPVDLSLGRQAPFAQRHVVRAGQHLRLAVPNHAASSSRVAFEVPEQIPSRNVEHPDSAIAIASRQQKPVLPILGAVRSRSKSGQSVARAIRPRMVQAHTRAICHAEIIGKIGREVDGTAHANQVLHSERAEAPPVLGFHGVSVRHAGEARRLQPSVLHPSGEVAHNPPVAQVGTERRSAL
mmetsp:Transcript_14279/g.53762  ORF Transcript_14279/g.53762 Transcript_14279/m.53762 type:complete len:242 (+) Transcript_14279:902-1627(+)